MKKLNITKEHFNKSRYFTKKYGKLKYVSESGRLFKTNKGKVLMFKEGSLNSDFDDDLDDDYYDGGHLDADEDNPKFSIGDKVIWNDSLWKVVDCWYDSIEGSNLYDLKGLDTRRKTSDVPGDELCAHDGGIAYESNRKFGKKFNEGSFQVLDSDGETTTLSRECPFCHKEHHITIDMGEDEFYDRYDAMRAGELIQRAFPMLDPNQREFIKTGICDKCWDSL